ncbi:hypothetical protein [Sphingomonas sp. LM7]|uniref:hypothetical protein n=1 Tax=Sphingomonas sp. LM7 TaxID=1938607 RepID=UPI000983F522|nr:hypothetical protein [Sphingomonas sp. LM7]AQR72789.1 hypothetical protein BXU08_03080 [Sphingomonas sp. LM7]
MQLEEQWDDEEAILRRLDRSESTASELAARITNSIAAANGAGLLALGGYLVSKTFIPQLVLVGGLSGLAFVTGLGLCVSAQICFQAQAEFNAERLRQRYIGKKLLEDGKVFVDSTASLDESARKARDAAWSISTWGVVSFMVGLILAISLVTFVALGWNETRTVAEKNRCAALRAKMVASSVPDAASADVFAALGCRVS